jgi:hypothetical protein
VELLDVREAINDGKYIDRIAEENRYANIGNNHHVNEKDEKCRG